MQNDLQQSSQEYEKLKSEISQRKDIFSKLQAEKNKVSNEKSKAENINTKFRKKIEDYKVPEVMEYVDLKVDKKNKNKNKNTFFFFFIINKEILNK